MPSIAPTPRPVQGVVPVPSTISVTGVTGLPEISAGDDLAALLAGALLADDGPGLADGDILVVTSKVVSKAEGRVGKATRAEAIETDPPPLLPRPAPPPIPQPRPALVPP